MILVYFYMKNKIMENLIIGTNMKAKDYKGIEDYIKQKDIEKKKRMLKGTIICKAKKCDNYLYGNQSTTNREYCSDCF